MTALTEYQRLEATGLWRVSPDVQRREVIVSLGDTTIVISDSSDKPLAHWSIAAVARTNPGGIPAIFHPDGDVGETLELGEEAAEMIAAMEKLRGAIARRRPRPGRLRAVSFGAIISGIAALGVFWLPDAMVRHALSVVPAARKATIGEAMLDEMRRMTGPRCTEASALPALGRLANRLQDASGKAPTLAVISTGVTGVKALPGGLLLVDRRLIEEEEAPDALAGYILAAMDASRLKTPLEGLLESSGIVATFQLLTTGELPPDAIREYSETLLAAPWPPIHPTDLLGAFRRNEVRSTPFANRLPEGHPEIQTLKAKDPYPEAAPRPVLDDADWVRLQGICGN